MVLAGVGGILVGLAPADLSLAAHGAGALLQVPGAVGPQLLGMAAWSAHRPVAAFSLVCGVVGSVASLLDFSQVYLGLGLGGMEHLAFDPLTVWTTALGLSSSDAGWRHRAPPRSGGRASSGCLVSLSTRRIALHTPAFELPQRSASLRVVARRTFRRACRMYRGMALGLTGPLHHTIDGIPSPDLPRVSIRG